MPFSAPSSLGDEVFGERSHFNLASLLSLPLGFLGVQPAHLLRRMTVQNPQEVLVNKEASCSLVDNASLGLQLPASGSGCLSPEGEGLQPASSVLPFVLCASLAVS